MGRKGMKGFLKGAHKHPGEEDAGDGAPEQASTSSGVNAGGAVGPAPPTPPKPAPAKAAAAQPAPAPAAAAASGSGDEDSSDDGGHKGPETRARMIQRHKRASRPPPPCCCANRG